MYQNAAVGIKLVAPDGRIIMANPAVCRMLGYTEQEIMDKSLKDLTHPDDLARETELTNSVLRGERDSFELEKRYVAKNGDSVWANVTSSLVTDFNKVPLYRISIIQDISERMRAGQALRESEERVRLAIQAGQMYTFEWDPITDVIVRSAESGTVLGVGRVALLDNGERFLSTVFPEDRERFRQVACEVTPDNPTYQISYRVTHPDGQVIWLEEGGRAFFDAQSKLIRVVGIAANITERKRAEQVVLELGGRLLNAQEEERRRIARELHDNIGQELALLAVQIQRSSQANRPSQISDLYDKVKEVGTKVSRLSHQLHSSELEFLGLGVAAEGFCRDFSQQYSVEVRCTCRDVPRHLDPAIALSFYRILQEALHNVAKHSRAALVTVGLARIGKELVLTVTDDGIGFDVEESRFASGLGLISMRERMHVIAGRLLVFSKPGQGTKINAAVVLFPATAENGGFQATS